MDPGCQRESGLGRTGAWLKFKIEDSRDFVVIGVAKPSEATFRRPALVLAGAQPHGLRYVGRVAVGSRELHAALDAVRPLLRAGCSAMLWHRQSGRLTDAGERHRGALPGVE